jgi:RimJ/RimL family protein N-acetyltransferase
MNKNNKFYLIKYYKKNIGYIRVELKKNKFIVSWALLNQFKGKGIMAKNLKKVTNNKKIKYTAIIKKNNLASIKVAKKSGFKFCSSDKNLSFVK